jgi:hypothetical protein
MSSIYETFSTSVSFIHLNIKSLVQNLFLCINNICSTNNKKNMCITLLVNLESTVGLSGKLGADLSTLDIFVIDSSEMSSIYEVFSTSVSFIHLNIQSLVPKLDLIYAEYDHFDIMSFTETWLKGDNSRRFKSHIILCSRLFLSGPK